MVVFKSFILLLDFSLGDFFIVHYSTTEIYVAFFFKLASFCWFLLAVTAFIGFGGVMGVYVGVCVCVNTTVYL